MYRRLHQLWTLPRAEKHLLVEATVFVAASRLALWLSSREQGWSWIKRLPVWQSPVLEPARITWAVAAIGARIPRATCLTQALAGREMLRRRGHRCEIRVGVKTEGGFHAHAWLLENGTVLLGGAMDREFTELWTMRCL